jgi:hypothetical protein
LFGPILFGLARTGPGPAGHLQRHFVRRAKP